MQEMLSAAKALREYCILTGRTQKSTDELIKQLAPFDGPPSKVTPEHLVNLRIALRNVCQDIDDYTLTCILTGRPPVTVSLPEPGVTDLDTSAKTARFPRLARFRARLLRAWPRVWQKLVLPGFAILLVVLAQHYSRWTFNTNLMLDRIDTHVATDVHEEVRDLVVIAHALATAPQTDQIIPGTTPTQTLFNEGMSKLTEYHFNEDRLHNESAMQEARFTFFAATWRALASFPSRMTAFFSQGTSPRPMALANGGDGMLASVSDATDPEASSTGIATDMLESIAAETAKPLNEADPEASEALAAALQNPSEAEAPFNEATVVAAIGGYDGFMDIVDVVAAKTGRNFGVFSGDHVQTRLELLAIVDRLKDDISIANRFLLPMIYGAMGATLFCLIRVLSPSLSELGPGRAMLRILFGAFAAMTLSMLFIPSNLFTINAQSNSAVVFLACFVVGYSFGSIIAALHRLEAYLEGRLTPQSGDAQGPAGGQGG